MKVTSPDFKDNAPIPSKFSCDGENISPTLLIGDIPPLTETLVLIADDPDAPSGNFTHWILWNIPSDTTKIESGRIPSGAVEGVNGRNKIGYTGPCPPSGTHRYIFHLFALDKKIELNSRSSKEDLEIEMAGKILEKAQLIGLYENNK